MIFYVKTIITLSLIMVSLLQAEIIYDIVNAAEYNNFKAVKERINDKNFQDYKGMTALMVSSESGNLEIAQYLIENKADINIIDRKGWTALHYAASKGHFDILELLLKAGANTESRCVFCGCGPLYHASYQEDSKGVELLLNYGADINRKTNEKITPLIRAVDSERIENVRLLINANAEIDDQSSEGKSALFIAVDEYEKDLKLVKLLVKSGANPNVGTGEHNPLIKAVEKNYFEVVKLLTESKYAINSNVLNQAIKSANDKKRVDLSEYLIKFKSDHPEIDTTPAFTDDSFFLDAIEKNDIAFIGSYFSKSLKLKQETMSTAMIEAVLHKNLEILEVLINNGGNVNTILDDKTTILMIAAENNKSDALELLLNNKANVNMKNDFGKTALLLAVNRNNTKIIKLLLEKGANVNASDIKGWTALMYAVDWGNKDIVKLLLEYNSEKSRKNMNGLTALDIARKKNYSKIVNLLEN